MNESTHTAEPWEACLPGDYGDYGGRCIVLLGDDMRVAVVLGDSEESKASADRIVACVNALAGMDPGEVKVAVEKATELCREWARQHVSLNEASSHSPRVRSIDQKVNETIAALARLGRKSE